MDIGCYKSAINRRPAIHTHAWFSNMLMQSSLTETSVPATSGQDTNKSWKTYSRSQGARCVLFAYTVCTGLDWHCLILWPMSFCPVLACSLIFLLWACGLLLFRAAFVFTFAAAWHWKIFAYAHAQWVSTQRLCLGHTMPSRLPYLFTHHLSEQCHVLGPTDLHTHFLHLAASFETAQLRERARYVGELLLCN